MTVCLGLGLPAMLSLAISLQPSESLMQPSLLWTQRSLVTAG